MGRTLQSCWLLVPDLNTSTGCFKVTNADWSKSQTSEDSFSKDDTCIDYTGISEVPENSIGHHFLPFLSTSYVPLI
ncbi:hypothetical protein TNIN_406261 [Trichonephila inaurata madagascariensis]|uniref:Uncharacterized protein n=1 Tax=Trichonephila inaurata madagascariensis TaxID=2747483 RepID=A0A8X7C5Y1_9ARAC|nr:hypothetical protein TNIN_406261 [Trichonephila inaurata madagascariensis]